MKTGVERLLDQALESLDQVFHVEGPCGLDTQDVARAYYYVEDARSLLEQERAVAQYHNAEEAAKALAAENQRIANEMAKTVAYYDQLGKQICQRTRDGIAAVNRLEKSLAGFEGKGL